MPAQTAHAVLPIANHDEQSRQDFAQAMRRVVAGDMAGNQRVVLERSVIPRIRRAGKRAPRDRHEIETAFKREPYYQTWSALQRITQEMMWDSVGESIERQLPALVSSAKKTTGADGSLTLDPALPMPRYIEAVDIHVMPGNFQSEIVADDVYAGALYDRGVYLYLMGSVGGCNEGLGLMATGYLKKAFPDFRPRLILDLGCSVGHSTLPYVDAYPKAAVTGLDVAAPQLRYAHARAESLGRTVHYVQGDACATRYPDGHFDLIVSHLLLHEMPLKLIRQMFRECRRLLAPGGMMLHFDGPEMAQLEPFDQFMLHWYDHNNNEPFSAKSHDMSFVAEALAAGFGRDEVLLHGESSAFLQEQVPLNGMRIAFKGRAAPK